MLNLHVSVHSLFRNNYNSLSVQLFSIVHIYFLYIREYSLTEQKQEQSLEAQKQKCLMDV